MAKKTTKRKPAKAANKKKGPAKIAKMRVSDIMLLGPKADELLKNPDFAAKFAEKKQAIIDGYNQIKSPRFCKMLFDESSGLMVLLTALPKERKNIKRCEIEVVVQTMVGDINYVESSRHGNLKRACEYISDFDQKQSARFCETAVRRHAMNVVDKHMGALLMIAATPAATMLMNKRTPDQNQEKK